MSIGFIYSLSCKNTSFDHAIVLPLPILDKTSPSPQLWPTDGEPRNFVCLQCWHVYEYRAEDVRHGPGAAQDQGQGANGDTVFVATAKCGDQDCGAPVRILAVAAANTRQLQLPYGWGYKEHYGVAVCPAGHARATFRPGSVSDYIRKDPDWE